VREIGTSYRLKTAHNEEPSEPAKTTRFNFLTFNQQTLSRSAGVIQLAVGILESLIGLRFLFIQPTGKERLLPYSANLTYLPEDVRQALPLQVQVVYVEAFNRAWQEDLDSAKRGLTVRRPLE